MTNPQMPEYPFGPQVPTGGFQAQPPAPDQATPPAPGGQPRGWYPGADAAGAAGKPSGAGQPGAGQYGQGQPGTGQHHQGSYGQGGGDAAGASPNGAGPTWGPGVTGQGTPSGWGTSQPGQGPNQPGWGQQPAWGQPATPPGQGGQPGAWSQPSQPGAGQPAQGLGAGPAWAPGQSTSAPGGQGQSPPPSAPQRSKTPLILGIAGVLALVLLGAFLFSPREPKPVPSTTGPTTRTTTTTAPPPSPTDPTATSLPTPTVAPVVPGWQAMPSANDQAAYDVPGDWGPMKPGVMVGYETKNEVVGARIISEYLKDSCIDGKGKPDNRGFVGFGQRSQDTNNHARAEELATRWARVANTRYDDSFEFPTGTPTTTDLTLMDGKLPASVSTITFTKGERDQYACDAPQLRVTVVAAWNPVISSSITLVVVSQQGIDNAMPKDLEDKIIATFRTAS